MAMLIPQTFLPWSEAPSCALPRPAPSIAPSAKPTGSASARSKSWVLFSSPLETCSAHLLRPRTGLIPPTVRATANHGFGINSAFDPPVQPRCQPRQSYMRRTSAAPRPSAAPAESWSSPLSLTSRRLRNRTEMPWSANSTPTLNQLWRQDHEDDTFPVCILASKI